MNVFIYSEVATDPTENLFLNPTSKIKINSSYNFVNLIEILYMNLLTNSPFHFLHQIYFDWYNKFLFYFFFIFKNLESVLENLTLLMVNLYSLLWPDVTQG